MEPTNEIIPISELVKVAQSNAMSINGISEQMGIVAHKLTDHDKKIAQLADELTVVKAEQTITRAQCRRIRKAIMNRVNSVLKIKFEGGKVADESIATDVLYRGGFISRCYTDAKNHSKMGESYTETLKVDFGEVMDYIEAWEPEVEGGTSGYMHYLDIRREEREKRSA